MHGSKGTSTDPSGPLLNVGGVPEEETGGFIYYSLVCGGGKKITSGFPSEGGVGDWQMRSDGRI